MNKSTIEALQDNNPLGDVETALMQLIVFPHRSYLHRVINVSCAAFKNQKDLLSFYRAIDEVMTANDDCTFQMALMNFGATVGKLRSLYKERVNAEQNKNREEK